SYEGRRTVFSQEFAYNEDQALRSPEDLVGSRLGMANTQGTSQESNLCKDFPDTSTPPTPSQHIEEVTEQAGSSSLQVMEPKEERSGDQEPNVEVREGSLESLTSRVSDEAWLSQMAQEGVS